MVCVMEDEARIDAFAVLGHVKIPIREGSDYRPILKKVAKLEVNGFHGVFILSHLQSQGKAGLYPPSGPRVSTVYSKLRLDLRVKSKEN